MLAHNLVICLTYRRFSQGRFGCAGRSVRRSLRSDFTRTQVSRLTHDLRSIPPAPPPSHLTAPQQCLYFLPLPHGQR